MLNITTACGNSTFPFSGFTLIILLLSPIKTSQEFARQQVLIVGFGVNLTSLQIPWVFLGPESLTPSTNFTPPEINKQNNSGKHRTKRQTIIVTQIKAK